MLLFISARRFRWTRKRWKEFFFLLDFYAPLRNFFSSFTLLHSPFQNSKQTPRLNALKVELRRLCFFRVTEVGLMVIETAWLSSTMLKKILVVPTWCFYCVDDSLVNNSFIHSLNSFIPFIVTTTTRFRWLCVGAIKTDEGDLIANKNRVLMISLSASKTWTKDTIW